MLITVIIWSTDRDEMLHHNVTVLPTQKLIKHTSNSFIMIYIWIYHNFDLFSNYIYIYKHDFICEIVHHNAV